MTTVTPIHPGEILQKEFLEPLGLSQNALAKAIHVSARRINEIVHFKRSITADTALRLSLFFGNSADFWMHLQLKFDLETVKDKSLESLKHDIQTYVA